MYNISKLEEARDILTKESLSSDDVRELLLYLVQRDDETRKAFKKIESMCAAFLKTFSALLNRVPPSTDIEKQREMQDALKAINEVYEALSPPVLLH